MNITKVIIDNIRYELLVSNENQGFKIHVGGADIYWTLADYYEDNEFIISKEDGELFSHLQEIFKVIEKNDDKYAPVLKNNVFEWISEARKPEESNKLIIVREEDKFKIYFILNPDDIYSAGMCAICFCLSGSRNQAIAGAFSMMFNSYRSYVLQSQDKNPIKDLINKEQTSLWG